MEICGCGHDDIVFDSRNCPMCESLVKIGELEKQVEDLEAELLEAREAVE